MKRFHDKHTALRQRQKGAITMFSAVMILILLTAMVLYALQVGVFEQRKSGNEMRHKQAFHLAEAGIHQAKQFFSANALLVSSEIVDQLPDGTDGWLVAGAERWQPCSAVNDVDQTHPCYGEPVAALRQNTYFYDMGDTDHNGDPTLSLGAAASPAGPNERLHMYALLCMLDIDRAQDPVVQGCTTTPASNDPPLPGERDYRYFMITLLARGEADCELDVNGDPTDCKAEVQIADKIGSFGPGGGEGGPGAPLTARTNVPPSGTVEVVPNPNGGGVGVPVSAWLNENPTCPPPGGLDPINPISGSYATCERHEWYGQDTFPDDYKCPGNTVCSCSKSDDKLLSYAANGVDNLGMDIVPDIGFPCDLFLYTFGIDKAEYSKVKALVPAMNQLTDCSTLDENSFGLYWISGNDCDLKDQVGSANAPVFLISAVGETRINAGAELFGVLLVTDVERPGDAEFVGNGQGTVYGAAIMDGAMENFNGTFQIVYLENVLSRVYDTGNFGTVAGGWTDFHSAWR